MWKITLFGLKSDQDLSHRAAHPHQEFPGVLPHPLPPPPGKSAQRSFAPLQKSHRNHRSYVCTEALFVSTQKLFRYNVNIALIFFKFTNYKNKPSKTVLIRLTTASIAIRLRLLFTRIAFRGDTKSHPL